MTLVLNVGPITNPNLSPRPLDRLLVGSNGGVLTLIDTDSGLCYTGADVPRDPVANEVLTDIAEHPNNGLLTQVSGTQLPIYNGRAFDFSALGAARSEIEFPAAIAEGIRAQTNQYFGICLYVKTPTKAEWLGTDGASPRQFCCFTSNAGGFVSESDIVSIMMVISGGNPYLRAFRTTTALLTGDLVQLLPADDLFDTWCQITYWRNASGQFLRIKPFDGIAQTATAGVGVKNTLTMAGKKFRIGCGATFYKSETGDGPKNWRLGRAFVENSEQSGRDFYTTIENDFHRVINRNVFI